ncbi:MAG: hypothetical protein ABIT83_07330 [Massilia sp.]
MIALFTAISLLDACTEEKCNDVSSEPKFKSVIGAEYEIIGPLLAYGIRQHSKAPVEFVSLIPPPGIEGSEVGFEIPVAIGTRITVLRVIRTNRVFDPPLTLVVDMKGTNLPIDTKVKIQLFRGNEGKGEIGLNTNIYRPLIYKP